MIQQKGIPNSYNGDLVVKFTDRKTVKSIQGYQDMASMSSWYEEDPDKHNLGLIKLWGQQTLTAYPMYKELLEKKAMMEVNGEDGSFSYDIAIKEGNRTMTVRDTSDQSEGRPGIDGSKFKITLSKQFAAGDVLLADLYGEQIIVTEDEVEMNNEGFDHMVQIVSNSRRAYYDASLLVKGVQYFKMSHAQFGEYATNYSNVEMNDTPTTMRCIYQLGNKSGVEGYVTGKANSKSFSGAASSSQSYINDLMGEVNTRGEFAIIADQAGLKDGKTSARNMRIAPTMELLVHREHQKLVAQALLFQKAGTVRGANGIARLNEGIWHQIRRGKIVQYGRPGGITRAHIKDAVEYVFRNNPYLSTEEREVVLHCGKEAEQNMYQIFKDEINAQYGSLEKFMGSDRALPINPVQGKDLLNLTLKAVRFSTVYIHGIGNITLKPDPSLNNSMFQDRLKAGMNQGGVGHEAYSIVIWDVADPMYSNNTKMPEGAKVVDGGAYGENIYIVKPDSGMTFFGSENGRFNSRTASNIVASSKFQGEGYFVYSICSSWVKDLSRYVIIELDKSAKKGFN
jgi:hypothetical protein